MKLPSRDFTLAGGLLCSVRELEREVWQEHVVKHPLGVDAVARGAAWNAEGWDTTTPVVIDSASRDSIVKSIAELSEGALRCEVAELRKKKRKSPVHRLECVDCRAPIVSRCAEQITHEVGVRYRDTTEALLAELGEQSGVVVPLECFDQLLNRMWGAPEKLEGIVVLMVGLDGSTRSRPVARINRHDGVRAEFFLEEPNRLSWRTTYRDARRVQTGFGRISFVVDRPRPEKRLGRVSELCVVARRWWESHVI